MYHPSYPRPSSEFSHQHQHTPNSLLNLNIGLLEPFMLVTFLIFVLNLISGAKILHVGRKEFDYFQQQQHDYDNFNYFMRRNSTE